MSVRPPGKSIGHLACPAFAKHLRCPASMLMRVVDLDPLIREGVPDWERAVATGPNAGLRTAGWSTLHWPQALPGDGLDTCPQ